VLFTLVTKDVDYLVERLSNRRPLDKIYNKYRSKEKRSTFSLIYIRSARRIQEKHKRFYRSCPPSHLIYNYIAKSRFLIILSNYCKSNLANLRNKNLDSNNLAGIRTSIPSCLVVDARIAILDVAIANVLRAIPNVRVVITNRCVVLDKTISIVLVLRNIS